MCHLSFSTVLFTCDSQIQFCKMWFCKMVGIVRPPLSYPNVSCVPCSLVLPVCVSCLYFQHVFVSVTPGLVMRALQLRYLHPVSLVALWFFISSSRVNWMLHTLTSLPVSVKSTILPCCYWTDLSSLSSLSVCLIVSSALCFRLIVFLPWRFFAFSTFSPVCCSTALEFFSPHFWLLSCWTNLSPSVSLNLCIVGSGLVLNVT